MNGNKKPNSFTTPVTSHGRITIPDNIRNVLEIREGDYVEVRILNIVRKEA